MLVYSDYFAVTGNQRLRACKDAVENGFGVCHLVCCVLNVERLEDCVEDLARQKIKISGIFAKFVISMTTKCGGERVQVRQHFKHGLPRLPG